jgi:hypothetical protein
VRIETFVYTHARVVELFLSLLAILASTLYSRPIFWIVNGMYTIYLFPDVGMLLVGVLKVIVYM